jgi:hypothetical protein
MSIFLTILFSLFAIISYLGLLGERDPQSRKHMTICFFISTLVVVAINFFGGAI